jgi:hypothetical protein
MSRHECDDTWNLIANADRRVHLAIPEMLDELRSLREEPRAGDAFPFILAAGERCRSAHGEIDVVIERDEDLRRGTVSLPHGYGMRHRGGAPIRPQINRPTHSAHCDSLSRTPYHKYVPVQILAAASPAAT